MLVCVDQLAACWLRGWFYVWLGMGELPSADETMSAFVGRNAIAGRPWALVAEKVIDFVMRQPGHCRAAIGHDDQD
jgi:hypothetical protein